MTTFEDQPAPLIPSVDYGSQATADEWLKASAWLPLTIGAVLERTSHLLPNKTAVVDDHERLTYAELEARSRAVAVNLLDGVGLSPGDRVLVQVGTSVPAVVSLLGMFRAGIVPVCAVPRYRMYEIGALADVSRAVAHLTEPGAAGPEDLITLSGRLRVEHPSVRWSLVAGSEAVGDAVAVESSAARAHAPIRRAPSALDVAAFQLSGGTTGIPKIIPRFHAEYLGYCHAWAQRLSIESGDTILWSLPITHNAGMLCFLLPTIERGATLVLQSRFDAEEFLATIERERVTLTGSIGPIAPRLLDIANAASRFDLSSLRLFLTLHRAAEIEAHLRVPALSIYGITEGLLMASPPLAPAAARHHTIGFPVSPHDEVSIRVPGEDREAAPGSVGELCFRGPSTLRSYYGNVEATENAFTRDRFFRSGDLVKAHEIEGQRYLSFEGRVKDNIDRGGEKFGTEEIELLLAAHPAILSAVAVGMPDPYLGERVCAFVIPRRGVDPPLVADVAAYLLDHGLAKFKCPERIELVDELPETSVGKLDRPALRRRIAETLAKERPLVRASILVVYHSGFGHTAAQARAVCEGALEVEGVESRMIFAEDAEGDLSSLSAADALIFGCPTYMGSASAPFKSFMDASSGIWLAQGWKDKLAAGFTNSGGHSGDKLSTLVQLIVFAMQHGMVWIGLGLPDGNNSSESTDANLNRLGAYAGAMAQSNVDQGLDGMFESDLATARALGRRVAEAAVRWTATHQTTPKAAGVER